MLAFHECYICCYQVESNERSDLKKKIRDEISRDKLFYFLLLFHIRLIV